jgi:hypothetical protein
VQIGTENNPHDLYHINSDFAHVMVDWDELSSLLLCLNKWMSSSGSGFWHTNWRMCGEETTLSDGLNGWSVSFSGGIL